MSQKFSEFSLKSCPVWATVGAVVFSFIISIENLLASTGPSWSKQAGWTNEETSHKSIKNLDRPGNEVSPFSPGSNNIAIDLGQVFLMGNLNQQYSDSIGTQIHYTYGVSDIFGFDSSVGYSEHSDGKFAMTTLLSGLRLNMSWYDKVIPYAIFGLGFYRPSYRDPSAIVPADSSISAVLFGVHLGPGLDLELSKNLFFGAALTFHNMFGTTKTYANGTPLNVGGSYTSFLLHLGATF